MVDDKKVYETLDKLVDEYKVTKHPGEVTVVDFKMFAYINSLDTVKRHEYLKYYFINAKTRK